LLFTASSIIIYQLTDPSPSELGKVETNNKTQPVLQRLYNLGKKKKKKAVLAGKNALNQALLGFVLPNPATEALLQLNWPSDRKQVVRNNP